MLQNFLFRATETPPKVCLSADCVTASAAILESLDIQINPCEDFYGFVCNGWINKHPIPKGTSIIGPMDQIHNGTLLFLGQSSWSVTDQRSEDNLEMLRTLLERSLDHTSSKSEQKAQV